MSIFTADFSINDALVTSLQKGHVMYVHVSSPGASAAPFLTLCDDSEGITDKTSRVDQFTGSQVGCLDLDFE